VEGIIVNHWLCILDRENFEVVKCKQVWGVSKRHKNQLMRVDVGDKLIFYLIGEKIGDEKKDSAIGGTFEVISRPYEDHKPVFPSQITKGEVYPYRVKVKPLLIPKEEVPFRPLIERLEFITNKRKWSGHLVGKAMREISERDYEVMRGWVEG